MKNIILRDSFFLTILGFAFIFVIGGFIGNIIYKNNDIKENRMFYSSRGWNSCEKGFHPVFDYCNETKSIDGLCCPNGIEYINEYNECSNCD